jgi:hypothetical protein
MDPLCLSSKAEEPRNRFETLLIRFTSKRCIFLKRSTVVAMMMFLLEMGLEWTTCLKQTKISQKGNGTSPVYHRTRNMRTLHHDDPT